jgi:hypothetical protein
VTEQDSGRAALVTEWFRTWNYWHDLVLSGDLGCLYRIVARQINIPLMGCWYASWSRRL